VDPGLRDGCRAPIPWDASALHGWTADPWLPFAAEAETRNVQHQFDDGGSMLHFYRRVLALRAATPAFQRGIAPHEFRQLDATPGLLAWARSDTRETWYTYINPTHGPHADSGQMAGATVVLCTDATLEGSVISGELPARVAFVARRDGTM
jgi:alpha-glucosidase